MTGLKPGGIKNRKIEALLNKTILLFIFTISNTVPHYLAYIGTEVCSYTNLPFA
jgi:hypothetical protein